jgi:8-oxo-dGTP pyrophosphatase MutT (NUDIX family)
MTETTLCFLIQGNPPQRILLGFKKIGFGAGKYTGFGGKVQAGETPSAAAIRELEEETGLQVREAELRPMGQFLFLFPSRPTWSQSVHVFVAQSWEGTLKESREMIPTWFSVDEIPLERMWEDGAYWLPHILAEEPIRARFTFGADSETIVETDIRPLWAEALPVGQ